MNRQNQIVRMALASTMLIVGITASCGQKSSSPAVSCRKVADHVGGIVRQELEQIDGDGAKTLLSSVPSLTKRIQEKCEQEGWSEPLIQCVLDAKNQEQVDRCESLMKHERANARGDKVPKTSLQRPSK